MAGQRIIKIMAIPSLYINEMEEHVKEVQDRHQGD